MYRRTDARADGRMDGQVGGWVSVRADRHADGQTPHVGRGVVLDCAQDIGCGCVA